ncbi:hypothetical protein N9997_01715 [Synechococcus sp. AH-603-L18]|nr:hypothetical protein [Synechococcus sp. AH-603-L18]MDB4338039.1 hypothetical protein [Synechococcus sp. AH-603-L18]
MFGVVLMLVSIVGRIRELMDIPIGRKGSSAIPAKGESSEWLGSVPSRAS